MNDASDIFGIFWMTEDHLTEKASILVSNFDRTYYIVLYTVRHSRNAATELLSIEYVQVRFKHRIEHSKLRTPAWYSVIQKMPLASFNECR